MAGNVQVNYINAHATSTLVGDVAELRAVKSAFPDMSKMKINGTKSMIGHCLGAAGGMEAIATLKAIQTGWVHPTLNQVCCLLLLCCTLLAVAQITTQLTGGGGGCGCGAGGMFAGRKANWG